jgi:glycosyltransferase involved in cell wall biosynthesis
MPCKRFDGSFIFKGLGLVPDRVWGLMLRKSKLYLVPELKQEIELQVRSLFRKYGVYHFLYGENEFRSFRPPKGSKLFVTYHFPPKKFEEYFGKPIGLKRANAVVVVGSNQIDYFSNWFPRDRVLFIPHGVDTEFFRPPNDRSRENKVLFVGSHLRDFDLLRRVVAKIGGRPDSPGFTIVTSRENWKLFKGLKGVELLSDIREMELLQLYQNHAALFLPLTDGTANNTILEAASSGLPIITTDVGAVRDYLDESSAVLIPPGRADLAVSAIMDLMRGSKTREELAERAREKMVQLDWHAVARKMMAVYEMC